MTKTTDKIFTVEDIRNGIGTVLIASIHGYVFVYNCPKGIYVATNFHTLERYSLGKNVHKAAKRFTKLMRGTKPLDIRGVYQINN